MMLKNVTVRRGLLCRDARRSVFNELVELTLIKYILSCNSLHSIARPDNVPNKFLPKGPDSIWLQYNRNWNIMFRSSVYKIQPRCFDTHIWLHVSKLWAFTWNILKNMIHRSLPQNPWKMKGAAAASNLLPSSIVNYIIRTSKDVPFNGLLVASCKQTRNNSKSPL